MYNMCCISNYASKPEPVIRNQLSMNCILSSSYLSPTGQTFHLAYWLHHI